MSLRQFSLTDFRNLHSTTIDFHPRLNLIYGDNASGKTSLLEAIHVNCQGQSFRQKQLTKCIRHGSSRFLLFGKFDSYSAGLSKSDKKVEIRVNGESVRRHSDLVRLTPVKVFNTDTFQLLTGSPDFRRQYLDWCLFHVEQSYIEHWLTFRHVLRQRNQLLKVRRELHLLDYWDSAIEPLCIEISRLRQVYCRKISDLIQDELVTLFGDLKISIEYRRGWDDSVSLSEQLRNSRNKDIRSGFTNLGIHRDNLIVLTDGLPVKDVLSRGQLKRLSLVLVIAALKIVSRYRDSSTILLLDDLKSEIDRESESIIYEVLSEMNLQTFITNISGEVPAAFRSKEFKMFHVEHGMIKPRKFS